MISIKKEGRKCPKRRYTHFCMKKETLSPPVGRIEAEIQVGWRVKHRRA